MNKFINHLLIVVLGLFGYACKSDQATTEKIVPETTSPDIQSYQDITVAEAKTIFNSNNTDIIFLDVRTPEEIAQGMIHNATTIDFRAEGFKDKISALDTEKTYVVYCRSGGRSAQASKIMEDLGFKDVKNILGGYTEWVEVE